MRKDKQAAVVGINHPTIDRDLKRVAEKNYVVIDGAAQAADLAISALKVADVVLIPVQPSPYDNWAASDLVDLVKQRIEMTDGRLRAAFVISRATKGTRIGAEVRSALEGYDLPVLEARITHRVSFPGTAAEGRTVLDGEPGGEAAKEFGALLAELKANLLRKRKGKEKRK